MNSVTRERSNSNSSCDHA